MSRTKRSHWMKEEMRDGTKRTHIKRKKDVESVFSKEWERCISYEETEDSNEQRTHGMENNQD